MQLRRLLTLSWATGVALLAGAAPAIGEPTVVAPDVGLATVSALGDRVVWSEPVGDGRYRLVTAVGGGPPLPVPGVRTRPGPFDVDLGTTTADEVVAVFSRCAHQRVRRDPGATPYPRLDTARGCRLRQYRFDTAEEQALMKPRAGTSMYLPTRWGRRVAYVRRDERKPRSARGALRLVVTDLVTGRTSIRPGGRAGYFLTPDDALADPQNPGGPGPVTLDLRRRTLATTWASQPLACRGADRLPPLRTQILVDDLRGDHARTIASACASFLGSGSVLGAAVLPGGDVLYGRNDQGPTDPQSYGRVWRWSSVDGKARRASEDVVALITSVAATADRLYAVSAPGWELFEMAWAPG